MNIIIVTHGKFGKELIESGKMIMGDLPNFDHVDFLVEDSLESLKAKIVDKIDDKTKTLLMTDIKGGSPFNVSFFLANSNENIEMIYGVNLPLVLSVASQLLANDYNLDSIMENLADLVGKLEED